MDIHFLQNLAQDNIILGQFIIFFGILITNIVPVMFFIYPDIFIFVSVFLVKQGILNWYIPFLILVFGAWVGEIISFYIGYKFGYKILNFKLFQKDLAQKWIKKLKENDTKSLIIGKVLPAIGWFIPVFSGIIKMNPKKFIIIDFIMLNIAIAGVYFTWLIGAHFLQKWFGPKIWIILGVIFIVYIVGHIVYEYLKVRKK